MKARIGKVGLTLLEPDCAAVLILFDADDDCPAQVGPAIMLEALKTARKTPCEVVMATREYEAWFLAAIESLRGKRGIRSNATSYSAPEKPRNAKLELTKRMSKNRTYSETADQEPLSATFDMAAAYQSCRSFRKLTRSRPAQSVTSH